MKSRKEELHPELTEWLEADGNCFMLRHPLIFYALEDRRRCARANFFYAEKTRGVEWHIASAAWWGWNRESIESG
jgi:hypothetical protein